MKIACTLSAALIACTASPNYWRAYTPISGSAHATRDELTTAAVEALTDFGETVETSAAGVVVTKWRSGQGFSDDVSFRFRVSIDEDGSYRIASLCRRGSVDCTDSDDRRPQWVLDEIAALDARIDR